MRGKCGAACARSAASQRSSCSLKRTYRLISSKSVSCAGTATVSITAPLAAEADQDPSAFDQRRERRLVLAAARDELRRERRLVVDARRPGARRSPRRRPRGRALQVALLQVAGATST